MYCVEFGGSTAKEAKVFVNGVEADAEVKEKDGLLTIAVTDVKPQDTVTQKPCRRFLQWLQES